MVQDRKRSKEVQVRKAASRKEEAVSAAGSLRGKLTLANREKETLKETVEVSVPLHATFRLVYVQSLHGKSKLLTTTRGAAWKPAA